MKMILFVDDSATVLPLMGQVLKRGKYAVWAFICPDLALTKLTRRRAAIGPT